MAERISYGGMAENNDNNNGEKPYLKGDEYELRPLDKKALDSVTPLPFPDAHSAKIVDIPLDADLKNNTEAATAARATSDMLDNQAVLAMKNTGREVPAMLPSIRRSRWPFMRRLGAAAVIAAGTSLGAHLLKDAHDANAQPPKNPERQGAQVFESGMQSISDAENSLKRQPNILTPEPPQASAIDKDTTK